MYRGRQLYHILSKREVKEPKQPSCAWTSCLWVVLREGAAWTRGPSSIDSSTGLPGALQAEQPAGLGMVAIAVERKRRLDTNDAMVLKSAWALTVKGQAKDREA